MRRALAFAAAALLAGCAQPPQRELATAAETIEQMDRAGTVTQEARRAYAALTAEVEGQNAKFALLRSYARSRELLFAFTAIAAGGAGETAPGVGATEKLAYCGHKVWTDAVTGCQYFVSSHSMTQRLDGYGQPLCERSR